MSEDYALRAMAIEECPQPEHVDSSNPGNVPSSSAGRFAKLKQWLHID
jgi:hypothetical protein